MIEVVLDQCPLGVGDCLLDCLELLGDVQTWSATFDHRDYAFEMSLGSLQPFDNFRMGVVSMFRHLPYLSPWRGYFKWIVLPKFQKRGNSSTMLLRSTKRPLNVLTAFMAGIAVLFLALAGMGDHAPQLHSVAVVLETDDHIHDHAHTHDDLDVDISSDKNADHHHADHTHDKAGLVAAVGIESRFRSTPSYSVISEGLAAGRLYGIDRPPRTVTLI